MSSPSIRSAPTVEDLPEMKELERKRREWALLERLKTGQTATGFAIFAECTSCHATVQDWRAHIQEVVSGGADGTPIRLTYPEACGVCGGALVELLVERR